MRVLVVDDSVVARRVVARALEGEPGFELAGVAVNGKAALEKIDQLRPDVVVLDLDMPVMDGFAVMRNLHETHPQLPVIVFSHLTHEGASATLDALALGATGFALKPRADGIGMAEEHVRVELLPLIAAVAPTAPEDLGPAASLPRAAQARTSLIDAPVAAVVIAVSTGGPTALAELIPLLPADLAVPVFIVQHMPALFTRTLAERLDKVAAVDVVEATDGEPVVAGRVYVAPGGRHLTLRTGARGPEVALNDEEPENSCRPSADVLFRSAARVYGAHVLAVVLTGMGSDGRRGCEVIRRAGGTVFAQDAASCVVASMPLAVVEAGLADAVLPLAGIGPALVRRLSGHTA